MSVLSEANDLINGPRAEAYGPAMRNLGRVAEQWNLYLLQRYGADLCLSAEDVCWMMADLKKCRQMQNAMRENVKDAAGYIGLIEKVARDQSEFGECGHLLKPEDEGICRTCLIAEYR